MLEKFRWLIAGAGALGTAFVLLPAAPASSAELMAGTFEMHNGFSERRRISVGTSVNLAVGGGFTVPKSAFSTMGTPVAGRAAMTAQCPPTGSPFCVYAIAAQGFQAFPAFPLYAQVASTYTEMNETTASLVPGGGPGSLAFCPVVGNPANGVGTKPACAGLGSFNGAQGIVQYTAGSAQFGGTMAIARRTARVAVSFRIQETPLQFQHDIETRNGNWMIGVASQSTFTTQPGQITPNDDRGLYTTGPVLGPVFTSIQTQGAVLGNGAPPLPSTSTGFPWTTGMVRVAEDSCLANPTQACNAGTTPNAATIGIVQFTTTGFDARNATGKGNITLVAGGIFQNRGSFSTGNWGKLNLSIGLPAVPSISRWGLVSVALVIPMLGLWIARSRQKK